MSAERLRYTVRNRFPGEHLVRSRGNLLRSVELMAATDPDLAVAKTVVGRTILLASHPDLAREVLTGHPRSLRKGLGLQRTRFVLGNGLLTSEGEFHLRQRRLAQPAFHRERIARYAEEMVARTEAAAASWTDGQVLDLARAMHHLTLDIVGRTLFGVDLLGRAAELGKALTAVLDSFSIWLILFGERLYDLPIPRMRRAKQAVPALDAAIYAIIEDHRRSGRDQGDLLSMLMAARDAEGDGSGMTDVQLRDEVMTLILAGHETTANALAWTWWFLAQHPTIDARLAAEVRDACGDRPITMADLPNLPYTRAVFSEAMRLRPPAYATSREVIEPIVLGGQEVPVGAQVLVSPWVTQRDPRWWTEPLRFDPDRWLAPRAEPNHRHAYFPFGGGTRVCIGEQFAWTEGILVIAALVRRWRFRLTIPASAVRLQAAVTLRPAPGIPVVCERRP
ncbi:MAG: cytochrome P450 [Gemmatimonadota bacterium]|jgi:cytochrome P450|nr:cytochrome P450 [Gemmatimonadota bacterium]MDQ8150024.1 cytochrome P450 [Gemmatimonadota bacterium]MDQ8152002.1 cytochrome P450 [Gemmatimonadota bacterium]MDQ8175325.1 cytochrome P450 [Gemmatimonadota bacterium]MDQ8177739.1 cytochrome P450 [Gemmatimonadota bacterium]